MTLLICSDGLIGDFLGVVPVMIELAKQDELHIKIHHEAEPIFRLISKKYNIKLQEKEPSFYDRVIELDISKAFTLSHENNYHMSQSHFAYLGLPVPENAVKAELEFEVTDVPVYDFVLAPFSRSLPPQERWSREQWQRLTDLLPGCSFCVIGHERDQRNFIKGENVTQMYSESLVKVMTVLKNAGRGLISVVSGPSHMAFHLGVKNYLISNQNMTWGNNPYAVRIGDHIPELTAERVIDILNEN
jgi:ADP-heptose:LPS heptosyltransferase